MAKIFITHDLRPGISIQPYEEFVSRVLAPTMKAFPTICGFSVFRLMGDPPGCAPFAYLVMMEVTNVDEYQSDTQTGRYVSLMRDWSNWVTEVRTAVGEVVSQ